MYAILTQSDQDMICRSLREEAHALQRLLSERPVLSQNTIQEVREGIEGLVREIKTYISSSSFDTLSREQLYALSDELWSYMNDRLLWVRPTSHNAERLATAITHDKLAAMCNRSANFLHDVA